MKAVIQGQGQGMLTVAQLPTGTLFKVNPVLSERLFVKCGDGKSTMSYAEGRVGNKTLAGANSKQPPVFAIIVPTTNRFDRRAFTPATATTLDHNGIDGNTPVVQTFGSLVIDLHG